MNTLKDIPFEKYDDVEFNYQYLNSHPIIGDESPDYNGIFHVHWRGPLDNDKIILQLKSILATQEVSKIFFWIEDNFTTFMSPSYLKLNQLKKYVEVKVFDKSVLSMVSGNPKNTEKIWSYYNRHHDDRRYKTDVFRWVILNIYGGVYLDLDMFLLKDLRNIRLNNYSSKWPGKPYAAADMLKLEQGSMNYEQIFLNNPDNPKCFLMMFPPLYNLEAYNMKYDNVNLTVLPTSFFDMAFAAGLHSNSPALYDDLGLFFKNTDKEVNLKNFFPGCFSYHWHNQWNSPELKNSYAGKLNNEIDEIIETKYNFKPLKIFQG